MACVDAMRLPGQKANRGGLNTKRTVPRKHRRDTQAMPGLLDLFSLIPLFFRSPSPRDCQESRSEYLFLYVD